MWAWRSVVGGEPLRQHQYWLVIIRVRGVEGSGREYYITLLNTGIGYYRAQRGVVNRG
jgi:hypothetical protein